METLERRIARLKRQRNTAYRRHADQVRAATEELDAVLEGVESQLRELEAWSQDPVVLVRNTPGPVVEVYHSAEEPCGKVNPVMVRQGRFDSMPLGEALAKRLRACTACAWDLKPNVA